MPQQALLAAPLEQPGELGVLPQECLDQCARVGAGLARRVHGPQVVDDFAGDVHGSSSFRVAQSS